MKWDKKSEKNEVSFAQPQICNRFYKMYSYTANEFRIKVSQFCDKSRILVGNSEDQI